MIKRHEGPYRGGLDPQESEKLKKKQAEEEFLAPYRKAIHRKDIFADPFAGVTRIGGPDQEAVLWGEVDFNLQYDQQLLTLLKTALFAIEQGKDTPAGKANIETIELWAKTYQTPNFQTLERILKGLTGEEKEFLQMRWEKMAVLKGK